MRGIAGLAAMAGLIVACSGAPGAPSASPTASAPVPATPTPAAVIPSLMAPAPTPTPAAQTAEPEPPTATGSAYEILLGHVPDVMREGCEEVVNDVPGRLATVRCEPLGPSEDVVYVLYDGTESMNAAYQVEVDVYGSEGSGTDCSVGPSEATYSRDSGSAGRLLCAEDTIYGGTVVAWWTDERLNIVSSVLLFSGTFTDLHEIWLTAGPE